jgi:CDP-L-myo-inositol myo-inositolphosphotransferase
MIKHVVVLANQLEPVLPIAECGLRNAELKTTSSSNPPSAIRHPPSEGPSCPPPLLKVFGLPLIKRVILTAKRAGFREFTVVIRQGDDRVADALKHDRRLAGLRIEYLSSQDGQSVSALLAAKEKFREPFLLLSANHLYEAGLLEALKQQAVSPPTAVICIDKKLDRTKQPDGDRGPDDCRLPIADCGFEERSSSIRNPKSEIRNPRTPGAAMDTGLYLYSPKVLDYSQQIARRGGQSEPRAEARGREASRPRPRSLERGDSFPTYAHLNQLLIQQDGGVAYLDVGDKLWLKIETAGDVRRAEEALFLRGGKSTDGIYARFNKQVVGRPLIYLFMRTPITPNVISLVGLALAVLSGVAFSFGGYFNAVLGAVLAYLSSIMDHCDGVVARLKHLESRLGTWLETACDYTSYIGIFSGMAIGLYRESGHPMYLYAGAAFALGVILSFISTGYQRKKYTGDRPQDFPVLWHKKVEADSANPISWFSRNVYFVTRRASMPYWVLGFTLLNLTGFFLFLCAFGANLFWILSLYSSRLFKRPD